MRYRYRTSCLLGGWKDTAEEACKDAIRARQAVRAEDGTMAWVGSAGLEAASIGQAARRIPDRPGGALPTLGNDVRLADTR